MLIFTRIVLCVAFYFAVNFVCINEFLIDFSYSAVFCFKILLPSLGKSRCCTCFDNYYDY